MIAPPDNQWHEPEWLDGFRAGVKAAQEQMQQAKPEAPAPPKHSNTQFRSFVTGSRAYGRPRSDSDIDLVAMVSPQDMRRLRQMDDRRSTALGQRLARQQENYRHNSASLRFGDLNLVCVTNTEDYNLWREATDQLVREAPVSHDRAVDVFEQHSIGLSRRQDQSVLESGFVEEMPMDDDGFLAALESM